MKNQLIVIYIAVLLLAVNAASLKKAEAVKKVIPKLVVADELSSILKNAEKSFASRVIQGVKQSRVSPSSVDLQLENIYFHVTDDIAMQLSNTKLVNVPAIDVSDLKPNLEFLNMALDLSLGSLKVEGSYEVSSKATIAIIPVTNVGTFSLQFEDIKVAGKVGLSIVEDSFQSVNYDVQYELVNPSVTVKYQSKDGEVSSGSDSEIKDVVITEHLKRELRYVLNGYIKKQLDEILTDMSVDELIGNTRMAQTYREHARQMRVIANDYVDQLLINVDEYVIQNHFEQLAIPNVEASFSKEILWVTWHGEFYTRDGYARNLGTLKRTADISLDFNDETGEIVVFGSLGLNELGLGYGYYSAKFMDIGPTGTVGATVGQNSLFLKVGLILADEPVISLQDFHIEYAKGISIEITGLGILDWLVSSIATWVVGLFNEQIVGSLDGMLKEYVLGMLPSVDANNYFG
ncbi:uncharacterized protein [Periplaneta americana]|uniref:uncharacterized protein n=1 Tax=Periplaneta americana TaxID=6978 RepID=UPI0037E775F6